MKFVEIISANSASILQKTLHFNYKDQTVRAQTEKKRAITKHTEYSPELKLDIKLQKQKQKQKKTKQSFILHRKFLFREILISRFKNRI